jgi:hypothetical protein
MKRTLLTGFFFLMAGVSLSLHAQEEETKSTPEKAFVRIVNASTVILKEPWRSGVDLSFKDEKLATDVRGGEAASYRQISFTGKDTLEARATGQPTVVGSVPAKFDKEGFYSIYLTGTVSEDGFKIAPLVIKDFPVPSERKRKGFARVGVFNAVSSFPVKLQIDNGATTVLPPMVFTEVYLDPGNHPYRLKFPYKTSERDVQGVFIVVPDSDYNAVIFASSEKPDRPVLRFLDNTTAKGNAEEALKNAEEEKKREAAKAGDAAS